MTTPSPFLPGSHAQFAWDATSIGWLKDCPRKYQYYMIEGWRPKGDAVDLTFGIFYHRALEHFDRLIANGQEREFAVGRVVYQALVDSFGWDSGDNNKNRWTLIRSIIWYLDEFATDPLKTVRLADGRPAVELSFRWDTGRPIEAGQNYLLSGHIDRLVEFEGTMFVSDRKTTASTLGPYYFARFDLDNQMSTYIYSSKIIWDVPIKGAIIDAAQIAVGFTRFARGLTFRTPTQLDEWMDDLSYWLSQAKTFAKAAYWPMNDRSCMLCAFKHVCSKSPDARQIFLESDFYRKEWNPLEVRT